MSCLAASPATPPAARAASQRLFAVAAPSPSRFPGLLCAVWRREGAGSSPRTMLQRCSSASEPRAAGDAGLSSFCIIEGPETLDFVQMQSQEIQENIKSRRNKIFLLMEEVRRLRVQQRIRNVESTGASNEENEMPEIPSTIPFMPHTSPKTMKQLYLTSFSFISGIIFFGGLVAPILELKLGLGGTSYEDFVRSMHLPLQLSQVDPIVASFSGGAVGVISALMLAEVKNVRQQEKKRCTYCHGTGSIYTFTLHQSRANVVSLCTRVPISTIALISTMALFDHGVDFEHGPLRPPLLDHCFDVDNSFDHDFDFDHGHGFGFDPGTK